MSAIEKAIGYRFCSRPLLDRALTHPSFANENQVPSNQRLEFLGDAVLELCVSEWLFANDAAAQEGKLTGRRAQLVCTETLAAAAVALGLGEHLRLGLGEARADGAAKPSILADALEAVIAAIYLDGGLDAAKTFVNRSILQRRQALPDDYKSRLQARTQKQLGIAPSYKVVDESGPDHAREYTVEVSDGNLTAIGRGPSRKVAEQQAAMQALQTWAS